MPTFNFNGTVRQRRTAEIAVFGSELTEGDYDDLAGDLTGDASIDVAYDEAWMYGGGPDARIRIRAENSLASTKVRLIPGRFDFSECKVRTPKHATGARILLKLALAAKSRGFARITARGERAVDRHTGELTSVGFYAFPRLGFDSDIPPETPARSGALAGCVRLSDLMATDAGRRFWLASGVEVPSMTLELSDNSMSWLTLTAFLAEVVQRRAYKIWEEHAREPHNAWSHWFQARHDLGIPDDFYL
ncbi:MAG TPA: hypothetical protein VGP76_16930 [Planctomycetaceae bacterium]|jgi:hypothetical protein|nr:hypothetical protein [Planctomycetaceae bacterium]